MFCADYMRNWHQPEPVPLPELPQPTWFEYLGEAVKTATVNSAVATKDASVSLASLMWSNKVSTLTSMVTGAATCYVGYRLYRRYCKPMVKVDPIKVNSEGLIPGSPLLEGGRLPDCQAKLALKMKDGTYMIVGSAIRVENHLITPTHNCQNGYDLFIVAESGNYKVDTDTEIHLAADASAFAVPERIWGQAGVKKARLGPLATRHSVTVTSGCDYKFSVGTVEPAQVIGRVAYDASTQPGFSGSAYMNGRVCVGMHVHGGARAGGYESLYLYCRLKHALKQKPESSEDFLKSLTKRKRNMLTEELDEEYVIVRTDDGNFHLTDRQLLERIHELENSRDWADETERQQLMNEWALRNEVTYWDQEDGGGYGMKAGRRARRNMAASVAARRSEYADNDFTDYAGIEDYEPECAVAQFSGESQQLRTGPTQLTTQAQVHQEKPAAPMPEGPQFPKVSCLLPKPEERQLTEQVEYLRKQNSALQESLTKLSNFMLNNMPKQSSYPRGFVHPSPNTAPPKQTHPRNGEASASNSQKPRRGAKPASNH